MAEFQVGFARRDITPPLGAGLVGFFGLRPSDGVLDPLFADVLAFSDGERRLLLIGLDNIGIRQDSIARIKEALAEETGLPFDRIFICCTHTHTAHAMTPRYERDYREELFLSTTESICKAAGAALLDLAPAEVLVNAADTPVPISFIRRFRMKDGSVKTNPGFLNPEIDHPLGEADHRVALTLFKRENKPEIALINFQTHPCVVGGTKISADYPHFLRATYEAAIPNSYCMFIDGAEGDTNHLNVTTPEELPRSGYIFAEHMGRTLAGTALSLYAMAKKINPLPINGLQLNLQVPLQKAKSPEELREAARINRLYEAGRQSEIHPGGGMDFVTLIAEARRMLRLEGGPDTEELHVTALRLGDFALVGFPGEPFTEIGRQVKAASPAKMTYIACCANGDQDYFPSEAAYLEGGYEARSSPFAKGIDRALIDGGLSLLAELFNEE